MKKKYYYENWLGIAVIVVVIVIGLFLANNNSKNINIQSDSGELKMINGKKYLVNPEDIVSGGPPKGGIGIDRGIPALAEKNIKFVSVEEADKWIEDNELVLALSYENETRVYPLQILVWHEIVNDKINGKQVLVTYCPLCGSGIAYERFVEINGEKVEAEFGTSGKLYNSNLVMYDDKTETYWQQIDGKAIAGDLVGQELKEISIDTVVWRDWKEKHMESWVLSQETGFNRQYGRDPYGNYYEDSFLLFDVNNRDDRIHPKTVVFGIKVNGIYKAYKEDDLIKLRKIGDDVNGIKIRLERFGDGRVVITNLNTGKEIIKERDFWFAWYAFHPDTDLYTNK